MKSTGRKTVKGTKVSAPLSAKATATATKTATHTANKTATKPATKTATESAPTATSASQPTHDEIAKRAYEFYLARGSVEGHQEEDWLLAEAELNRGS